MAADPIAARYAHALFETATAEGQIPAVLADLTLIGRLLREEPDLRQFLYNPDVDPDDKVALLDRALHGSWSAVVRAFLKMVVSMGRSESLAEMVEAFQAEVDAAAGRVRAVLRSARPLPEALVQRLRNALEHRERKTVELHAEVAPELLGGVQVVIGYRRIDGSVRRQLLELHERLGTVRVA